MTIKHLYPNARPSLDLKFAKDKVLDPRITYSRSSSGTYFDSTGTLQSAATNQARFDHDPTTGESLGLLVEEARTNLRTYSNIPTSEYTSFLNRATIVPSAEVAPDGTISGVEISNNTGVTDQYCWGYFTDYASVPTTGYICASIFVKMVAGTEIEVKGEVGNQGWIGFAGVRVNFSTETPTVTLLGASGQNAKGGGAIPYPNGWWRIWYYIDTADGSNNGQTRAPGVVPRIAGTSACIWGAQIEAGSFPTSYIPTPATFTSRSTTATYYDANGIIQTAGINVARDDAYFPDENGVFKPAGLLLEAAGTNLHVGSTTDALNEDIVGLTQGSVTTTDPTGSTSTVETWTVDTSTGEHDGYRFYNNTYVDFTWSLFVKANGITRIQVSGSQRDNSTYIEVDLTDGSIINQTDSYATATPIGGGWVRISSTKIANRAHGPGFWLLDSSGNRSFTGNGTDGVYVWGIQLEQQAGALFPTSYIPTAGSTVTRAADVSSSSTVTRSADVAQITGSNFSSWYNQSEGTVLLNATASGLNTLNRLTYITDGSSSNSLGIVETPTITQFLAYTSGVQQVGLNYNQIGLSRKAFAYSTNDTAFVADAGTVLTDTSITPPTVNQIDINSRFGANPYNGHISRLTYYPVRLPDATLQTITS